MGRRELWAALLCLGVAASLPAQEGIIEGRVVDADGTGLGGVMVSVGEGAGALTDGLGDYVLAVPFGNHDVVFSAAGFTETVTGIEVPAHGKARLDQTFDWDLSLAERTVVRAASRRNELVMAAPLDVNARSPREVESEAAHGQAPKLVEFTTGAQLVQSGLYDINLATRSFNDALSRRVAVRIDERDPSMIFLGGQEWAALSLPLADLSEVELARGPLSSLYGANAAGGVLSLVTRAPRENRGSVSIAGGEPSSVGGDLLWSQRLAEKWYSKVQGSYRDSEDFNVSRVEGVEYSVPCSAPGQGDCLPTEAVSLDSEDKTQTGAGAVRVDFVPERGGSLSLEAGASDITGPVLLTDLGRLQVVDDQWSWGRFDYALGPRWGLFGSYRNRDAGEQTVLGTGHNVVLDEDSWRLGARTSWSFGSRVRLLAGLYHEDDSVETSQTVDVERAFSRSRLNPFSREGSLLWLPVDGETDAAWASMDWQPTTSLTLALGARYDDSSRFDPQWSPRASLVFQPSPAHTLRLVYSSGFEAPTYGELALQYDTEPAVNLAVIEPQCRLWGVDCGFDFDPPFSAEDASDDTTPDTRNLLLGNENLDVEQTQTLEVGYRASPGRSLFLDLTYHRSEHDDLITGPLPQIDSFGFRINPSYGPYEVPAAIPQDAAAQILADLAQLLGDEFDLLSTNSDGTPILARYSYANIGSVDTQGADLGLDWRFAGGWSLALSYSWLDFDISSSPAGLEEYLVPNAPEHRASASFGYSGLRFDAAARYRWVDEFRWVSGPFRGTVESYGTVDLFANVHLGRHFGLGVNVANLLDEEHWQAFGGAIQQRRALGSLTVRW